MHLQSSSMFYKAGFALAAALLVAGFFLAGNAVAVNSEQSPAAAELNQTPPTPTPGIDIDHSKLPTLFGPFGTPQEVTQACLSCHKDAATEIMHTTHWTWEFVNEVTGQTLGKKTLINNFCIGIQSNEPRCTSCHVGYGWKDNTFDFTVQENVDCLVCHDTTGTYKKFPTGAGLPVSEPREFPAGSGNIWQPPDLENIAQNVGLTSRQTCGVCHFYGGGGDEVKHGDMDSSLVTPPFELDVHMSLDGQNFTCTTCHMTDDHAIVGSRYSMDPEQWKGCEDCHTAEPHPLALLNQHTDRIACQTCHIPEFARGGIATKMTWDWSKAGELTSEGKPVVRKDENGRVIYDGQKGEFTYGEFVIPEYVWFNGQVEYTLAGETFDPTNVVRINQFLGDRTEEEARIWPVKRFRAVQPYDSVNNTLVVPHLFGSDDSAFWGNYDWNKAITFGMEYAGLEYSGEYGFIESEFDWPITHMVAPATAALVCQDCHTPEGGRLDFVALGYSESEATRLVNFPPTLSIENQNLPENSPDSCAGCHVDEHRLWTESIHLGAGVGCVSCHQLEEPGEHPLVAFTMERAATTCGACHLEHYNDWQVSQHGQAALSCGTCHNPHSQEQKVIEGSLTVCETCHTQQAEEALQSTHHAVDTNCLNCHKNTDQNTGHTFAIGSDTCIKCHGEEIHSADTILSGGGLTAPEPEIEATPTDADVEAPATEKPQLGAGISIPWWAAMFFAVVIGMGGYLLFGHKPDHDNHKS
jgi:octaheme c-type cytochrome (tetrathionate reductase family)